MAESISIEQVEFSPAAYKALTALGVKTLDELPRLRRDDVLEEAPPSVLKEIEDLLGYFGLSLRDASS